MSTFTYSVFTKPWKTQSPDELGGLVAGMGFNAVEFALRDGYQAQPGDATKSLPQLAKALAAHGVKITSVASAPTEEVFAACEQCGVPLIRIMYGYNPGQTGYMQAESGWKREMESFLPLCEKYGVKVGVQQHYGAMVNNSMELRHLLEGFPVHLVGAVWDAAHSGLANEEPEQALDILWDHLVLVNFKNAYHIPVGGLEKCRPTWNYHFTTGEKGICDWERAVKYLHKRGYDGVFCMPAEYTDEAMVEVYAPRDLAYLMGLVDKAYGR